MPTKVPYEINPGARLLAVGEAPGETERLKGRPFVGDSGELWDNTLLRVGMQRKQFTIANACNYQPPGNKIKKVLPSLLEEGREELKALIAEMKPLAILAMGNTAMQALLGYDKITHRRGSVYHLEDGTPVLPTLHPAAVLRKGSETVLFVADIRRFKRLAEGADLSPPKRTIITNPTEEDIVELERRMKESRATGADIESDDKTLACCGFAPSPDWCVVIPADTPERRAHIRRIIGGGYRLIFHNSPYDLAYLMFRCGYKFVGELEDTLAMHQALHPELPRSLEVLTSLYTLQPYYKDMYTDWTKNKDFETYYQYNGLDCCVTTEIWQKLDRELDVQGLRKVYEDTRRVLPHAIDMALMGMRYDSEEAARLRQEVHEEIQPLQAELDELAGRRINVFSPPQVSRFLRELKIPLRQNRDTGSDMTSEKVLMSVYAKIPDPKIRRVLELLFAIRHRRKFISSYLKVKPSSDGRVRTTFNPMGTETGRWSASKFIITEGANLQTVPPQWKRCFPADDGMVLWFADYSQIEARFVAWLAHDLDQMALFNTKGGDIHKYNASLIYNKRIEDVTPHERQVAKSCVHALNYGIGAQTLMETVNKKALETNFWLSLDMAKKVRAIYLERFQTVVDWQNATWQEVKKYRRLTNPFGRMRIFLGSTDAGKPADSEHTKKEGLAFKPQSTVPDMMNRAILTLREDPERQQDKLAVALQIHDALGGWAPEETQAEWLPKIVKAMDIPVTFDSGVCNVPVEIKVGKRWSELKTVVKP